VSDCLVRQCVEKPNKKDLPPKKFHPKSRRLRMVWPCCQANEDVKHCSVNHGEHSANVPEPAVPKTYIWKCCGKPEGSRGCTAKAWLLYRVGEEVRVRDGNAWKKGVVVGTGKKAVWVQLNSEPNSDPRKLEDTSGDLRRDVDDERMKIFLQVRREAGSLLPKPNHLTVGGQTSSRGLGSTNSGGLGGERTSRGSATDDGFECHEIRLDKWTTKIDHLKKFLGEKFQVKRQFFTLTHLNSGQEFDTGKNDYCLVDLGVKPMDWLQVLIDEDAFRSTRPLAVPGSGDLPLGTHAWGANPLDNMGLIQSVNSYQAVELPDATTLGPTQTNLLNPGMARESIRMRFTNEIRAQHWQNMYQEFTVEFKGSVRPDCPLGFRWARSNAEDNPTSVQVREIVDPALRHHRVSVDNYIHGYNRNPADPNSMTILDTGDMLEHLEWLERPTFPCVLLFGTGSLNFRNKTMRGDTGDDDSGSSSSEETGDTELGPPEETYDSELSVVQMGPGR